MANHFWSKFEKYNRDVGRFVTDLDSSNLETLRTFLSSDSQKQEYE